MGGALTLCSMEKVELSADGFVTSVTGIVLFMVSVLALIIVIAVTAGAYANMIITRMKNALDLKASTMVVASSASKGPSAFQLW